MDEERLAIERMRIENRRFELEQRAKRNGFEI